MVSRLFNAIAATALVASSSMAVAQSAPAPARETVSSDDLSSLRGNRGRDRGAVIGVAFLLIVIAILIFVDNGDDDDEEVPGTP